MRIKQISVTKLFGVFDHTITLNMDERITIIHGPNGFGKTILLRMVDGLFNSRYTELVKIPFDEFRLDFDDESYLTLKEKEEEPNEKLKQSYNKKIMNVIYTNNLKQPKSFILNFLEIEKNIALMIKELKQQNSSDDLTNEQNMKMSVLLSYFLNYETIKKETKKPDWFIELTKCINVRLITTQRLLNFSDIKKTTVEADSTEVIESVETYSKELAEKLQEKLAEYGALSQSLDRTFPARVVNQKAPSHLTEEMLRHKLSEIEEKRSNLINVGLLDKDENPDFQVKQEIDETTKNILSVYLEDVEKKLAVFKDMAMKLELFQRIIRERFKYKTITISKDNGFTFTTANGKPLSPTDLSSGEQHELVLLYELLFKVKPNSLILIDEPELSFHVGWQVQFLKDLQDIIGLADFDVLMATHSPDIISDRWDLTVELKGPIE
ncbi:MAG TPA: AAA family ATPase [Halomicronema sp.]